MKCSMKTKKAIQGLLVAEFDKQMIENGGSWLDECEQVLRNDLLAIGKETLGELLSSYDERVNHSVEKCACGGAAKRQLRREAQLLSVFGWTVYQRGYYHCAACGSREYRLDVEQGIRPRQASREMAKLMSMAGVTTSFAEASKQLAAYLLVEVSPNTIRKETYAAGQRQAENEAEEIADSQQEERLQQREREWDQTTALERVYGSIDGAQAPTTTGWREVKSLSWYQSQARYGNPDEMQATEIEYRSELSCAEEFGRLLWASGLSDQVDRAKEQVFVCDGAVWIWKLVEQYFPDAVQIVDWYHACQYLHPIAEAVFGASPQDKEVWITETEDLLWKGKIDEVLAACLEHQQHSSAQQAAEKAISYFTNNAHRMDYQRFREAGYFIGSGTIESACKQIVTARLKKSGARWLEDHVSLIAKARAAYLSGGQNWQKLFALPLAA